MKIKIQNLLIALALTWLTTPCARGQVIFTNLVFFTGTNGPNYGSGSPFIFADLNGAMVQAGDGNFYGTTECGGLGGLADGSAYGLGTVFRMTPQGVFTNLYQFGGNSDGEYPIGNLIKGADGNLYGTALFSSIPQYFETRSRGNVFQITTSGAFNVLYNFDLDDFGGSNDEGIETNYYGLGLEAGVVQGSDGNFYGTTIAGGANGYGTIFQLTPGGGLTTLHAFAADTDGFYSFGSLVQGKDGNFYGTTSSGGANGFGTVFKITSGGTFTNIYSFTGLLDGGHPYGGLVQGRDGNFYGTTRAGGAGEPEPPGWGVGTVFQITTNGTLTTLHTFNGIGIDGGLPCAGLIQASDGNFYGTTEYNTVFEITTNGAFTLLYTFSGSDGLTPTAQLVQGSDGSLYGTTAYGGIGYNDSAESGNGTIFRITIPPVFQTITPTNGKIVLAWSAMSNQVCQLQYNTNLASTNWINLGSAITTTNSPVSASDSIGTDAQRFYRIQLLP